MIQLNIDDVNLHSLECTVVGKGNKQRIVYLDSVAGMVLSEYLNKRKDDNEALFVQEKHPYGRLTAGGVRAMLHELGKRASVNHVHPHKFRRTRATNLIRHGVPIQEVAVLLGHEKIDTTMGYIVNDQDSVKNSVRKFA